MIKISSTWRSVAVLAGAVLAAIALVFASNRLPEAGGTASAPSDFAAGRAMADIRAIAAQPHPTGTAANAQARAHILMRLRALGLTGQQQPGVGISVARPDAIAAGSITNIVATIPGRDRTLPALVLMAHYDSVPNSPGAADDALGCAVLLETARAILAGGPPGRDVVLLFTDGEEPGLLGSSVHFADPQVVRRTGMVLNFEAMGDGGRALMFETSAGAGNLVRLYANSVALPAADSFSASLYRLLPNNTDLTRALERGVTGLNFAITARRDGYHSMRSVPDHVDPRSVQHMGDIALSLTRRLADAPSLPQGGGERVYFDLAGTWLVHYPSAFGWIVLVIALAAIGYGTYRLRRRDALSISAVLRGVGWMLATTLSIAVVLWLVGILVTLAQQGFGERSSLLEHAGWVETGVLAIAAALLLVLAKPLQARRRMAAAIIVGVGVLIVLLGGTPIAAAVGVVAALLLWFSVKRPIGAAEAWLGGLLFVALLAVAFQHLLPGGGYLVVWPLLGAAIAFALLAGQAQKTAAHLIAAMLGVVSFAFVMVQLHGSFIDFGFASPQVMAIFVPLVAIAVLPWLFAVASTAKAHIAAGALAVAGLGCLVVAGAAGGVRNVEVLRLVEAPSGRQYLASTTAALDDRARTLLSQAGSPIARRTLGPPIDGATWLAPVAPAPAAAPAIQSRYDAARRRLELTIQPRNPALALRIALKSSVPLGRLRIAGNPAAFAAKPGAWATIRYGAPPAEGLTLTFDDAAPGTLDLRVLQIDERGTVPNYPAGTAPWRYGGMTFILDRRQLRWGGAE